MNDIAKLEKKLDLKFKEQSLLQQALVHRSYINEHPEFKLDHNERLEFLGDAVLELVVTEHLYRHYPNPEGDLTNWRASLVNRFSLAQMAADIGLEPYILMSRGEAKDKNSKARQYIMANASEAVIGAIYLDQGIKAATKFINKFVIAKLANILEQKLYIDAKSHFQEKAQEEFSVTPTYRVISSVGPDHAKIFKIGIYLDKELIATGSGSSKQEAQTDAAKNALAAKNWH